VLRLRENEVGDETIRSRPSPSPRPSGRSPVEIVFAILVILVVLKMTQFVRMGPLLPKRTARTRLQSPRYGNRRVGTSRLIFAARLVVCSAARKRVAAFPWASEWLTASPRSPWDPASNGHSPKQSLVLHRHKLSINFRFRATRSGKRFKIAVSLEPHQSKEFCLTKRQSLGLESRVQHHVTTA